MPKLVHLVSLGCPKNRVDSELMLGNLLRHGYVATAQPEEAHTIIVNTCAFIGDAKEESINTVLELARLKTGKLERLVVAGCLPQRYGEALARELPEVDLFLGTSGHEELARLLAQEADDRLQVGSPGCLYTARSPRVRSTPRYTSYLKISEGCDHRCAYCVIPSIRGPQRSRPVADVVAEARSLAKQGCVELNLVAQDLTAYGSDLPERPNLAGLLRELCKVRGVRWIRLLYAYPRSITPELIEVIAGEEKIVKSLDLPIQHINDRRLVAMGRGKGSFLPGLLSRLREKVPGIVLRTSLIVGLPTETEEEFEQLKQFVEASRFEHLGCFAYSPEEGTPAAAMEGQVPRRVATRRRREIMALQKKISRAHNRSFVGKRIEVLVEGVSPETEHLLVGRHAGQAAEIDGITYLNDGMAEPGEIVTVEVVQAADYDLVGGIVSEPPAGGKGKRRS